MKATGSKRERGAYFTPAWMARALASWAIRTPQDSVIDPAAGRGELLVAAAEQLLKTGGEPRGRVFGVELHERTARGLRTRLSAYASARQLLYGDLFLVAGKLPKCDVVIANPPYVRHQQIPARDVKRMRAALDGRAHVVGGKASAWAYFLVHAPGLLKPHGRMAFVLPGEVLTSDYAAPIVDYLASRFRAVRFVYCEGVVFRGLSQQTVLCLVDDYDPARQHHTNVQWARLPVGNAALRKGGPNLDRVGYEPVTGGATLARLLAPLGAVEIERGLRGRSNIKRLGDLASISIGYVTGSNRFFHLSEPQHKKVGLHARHLTRIVPRSGDFSGLDYTQGDWARLQASGSACWLLSPRDRKDEAVSRLLDRALKEKIHKTHKCGSRPTWWKVPTRDAPPAFMSYMGANTRVIANSAAVLVPNSLYELRDLKGVSPNDVAVASMTSVFQLSALLNARLLGGGLRKLEPSDAARTLVPIAHVTKAIAKRIDGLVRRGLIEEARKAADQAVLVSALGMSVENVRLIQRALSALSAG